jgi:phospholipase C
MDRREFLSFGAGAAALASGFPAIARALSIPAAVRTGTIEDVEHVVILMQENRSFDHYFGTMAGVRGFSDPYPAPAPGVEGAPERNVFTQLNETLPGPRLVSPFPLNTRQSFAHMRVEGTPHYWDNAQAGWNEGRLDRWPEAKELHSLGYYEEADLPFQYALANAFTLCDAYHCSFMGGTNPNRLFLWTGTNDGAGAHNGPAISNSHDSLPSPDETAPPYTWTTYVERLQAAGIDWAIYQDMADNFTDNPLPGFKAFQDSVAGAQGSDPELVRRGLTTRALDALRADVAEGRLPQVSYIVATAEGSEHPGPSSPAQGAAYTAEVLDALTSNPDVWSKTVLLIMFDENDGFFDHVPPPAPPSRLEDGGYAGLSQIPTDNEYHLHAPDAGHEEDNPAYHGRPYGLGPRVPAYVVSPFSRGGQVCSEVMDHTSVIRFLEARFGVMEPNISEWRRAVCGDFLSAFDFAHPNEGRLQALPDPRADAIRAAALPGRTTPPIPETLQDVQQAVGEKPHRPCLYDLEVIEDALDAEGLTLTLVNRGARAAVLHVYDRLDLDAVPWRYTLAPGGQESLTRAHHDGRYDLQIMGPEGFHRRLTGTASGIAASARLSQGGESLRLEASGPDLAIRFGQAGEAIALSPASLPMPLSDHQGYDLTVTGSDGFMRQFAGRLPKQA